MNTSYVAERRIDLGEKIHLRSEVIASCGKDVPFLIRNARFELHFLNSSRYGLCGDTESYLEDSGDCIIKDHELDAVIQPKRKGIYEFKYIYEVADEIWVDVIKLVVS